MCMHAHAIMLLYNLWPTVLHAKLILQCHDHVYIQTIGTFSSFGISG